MTMLFTSIGSKIMSPQLKQQIENHLNSIGDEQYDEEGLTCLLQQANSLLVDVLTEEEEGI